ncbi:MAG: LysE family transporter [Chloroflexi bacterium]|nr:LysE family transporter [Chloroflexota bacterium]
MLLGLSVAAPVGAIGVLIIRRSLAYGWRFGFVSGLGVATADAAYGAIAAFGLTALTSALTAIADPLRLFGGLFLLYLGIRTFLARAAAPATGTADTRRGLPGAYLSIFALTIVNPQTVLTFLSAFAGLGALDATDTLAPFLMVGGVFLGSVSWWFVLSSATSALRTRIDARLMTWINRISGAIVIAFALAILLSLVRGG